MKHILLGYVWLLFYYFCSNVVDAKLAVRHRVKPREGVSSSAYSTTGNHDRVSILNMTCSFYEQPLNHFDLPRGQSGTYMQRYCIYDKFVESSAAPVFFYTGNESPLEQYINNTGLMWELAPRHGALVVFVEHRYEGQSLPLPNISKCMAYSSTVQALADYARFIENKLFTIDDQSSQVVRRPVIAFGGSYGGMISAWMRMKYPNIIAGAVAASAPIWAFPRNFPSKIDTAWQVIAKGLELGYPPTEETTTKSICGANLLAAWSLIKVLGASPNGRLLLTEAFSLCEPIYGSEDADNLITWAQSPWFDLAEGSFPYPSSYITYALTHDEVKLPAWPLQAACWNVSKLHESFGIEFEGDLSNVKYNVSFNDGGLVLSIDWDKVTVVSGQQLLDQEQPLKSITGLLESVRDAVSIWFNVTQDVECYNTTRAPNTKFTRMKKKLQYQPSQSTTSRELFATTTLEKEYSCTEAIKTGSWPSLCCNEEINLIITAASGLGRDIFWPPTHSRNVKTYADIVKTESPDYLYDFCKDPQGIYGFPQDPPDPWSTWLDTYYEGTNLLSHSNIVFTNGLLDVWSAGGVYSPGQDPTFPIDNPNIGTEIADGLFVQNITSDGSMQALLIKYGGHHTDLMYSDYRDPPCVTVARQKINNQITRWINEF